MNVDVVEIIKRGIDKYELSPFSDMELYLQQCTRRPCVLDMSFLN
jgi:hypothetical protein